MTIYNLYKILYNSFIIIQKGEYSVERNFPVILCELRKEKGLSQKDAAAKLGISQALLSHYEKGIRECGQSFLIKVADFYDVTCDYLLGRTPEKNDMNTIAATVFESSDDDKKPTSQTLVKASLLVTHAMRQPEKLHGIQLEMLFAIALYKIILLQANAGNLPKNWAGRAYVDGKICCNSTYLGGIELVAYNAIKPHLNQHPDEDAPVPEAIKTLVSFAENYILKNLADSMPPMPPEFFR